MTKNDIKKESKKETKKEIKKVNKKAKTNTKKKEVKKDNAKTALLITFIVMTIMVVILFIVTMVLYNKRKEEAKKPATIQIVSENIKAVMNIDVSNMKKDESKEYLFNISNYGNKLTAKKEIEYTIKIGENKYNLNVELYKNNKLESLDDNKNSLTKNKKQLDEYKLIITSQEDMVKNSKLKININS